MMPGRYLISNKNHATFRLAAGEDSSLITTNQDYFPDQVWEVAPVIEYPNFFTLENVLRHKRLGHQKELGLCDIGKAPPTEQQLWSIEKVKGKDGYRLATKARPNHRLTLFAKTGELGTFDGDNFEDQIWTMKKFNF